MENTGHESVLGERMQALPLELRDIIRRGSNTDYLAALSKAALDTKLTDTLLSYFEPVFADVCARWTLSGEQIAVVAAFGRVLPFAPHFAEYAEAFFKRNQGGTGLLSITFHRLQESDQQEVQMLCELLLGIFRLLVFDNESFGKFLPAWRIQLCLGHANAVVRYLAIRVLCLYLHAADAAMERMICRYMGDEAIEGEWEGKIIDWRFLSLWEEKRHRELRKSLGDASTGRTSHPSSLMRKIAQEDLSPLTVEVYGVLLPKLNAPDNNASSTYQLVPTSTTVGNLTIFARALLGSRPILLHGLAGSGKTSVVKHMAQRLNKFHSMVTLHLNEQSDAKMLIGMYTTGSKPGTFTWRPGVLTTAVREGRWVFIEGLDRAPNDIISTLLPLIERGELLISGRGEVVRASRGFKIIATIRTTLNLRGEEAPPASNMIGRRFWRLVHVEMPAQDELRQIIEITLPPLAGFVPNIMSTYKRLQAIHRRQAFIAGSETGSIRPITLRDLMKWCSRIAALLSPDSTFTDSRLNDIFMEAVDCFAGGLQSGKVQDAIIACIAEELHVDPQRRDHLLLDREIKHIISGKGVNATMRIGRITLHKGRGLAPRQRTTDRRPFAMNGHTLRLLEKVAVAVERNEPLLLVGETGTGKTTCIQHLAEQLGRKLVAFNLSQQSESGDLLGGFKPVNVRSLVIPMTDEFDELFSSTFSRKSSQNQDFTIMLNKFVAKGRWDRVCKLWNSALGMVDQLNRSVSEPGSPRLPNGEQPSKKRRVNPNSRRLDPALQARWDKFAADVKNLESQFKSKSDAFAFTFVEGNIVKAVRNGDWVLLDEINLASPDTLESIADLLGDGPGGPPSLLLTETGSVERIEAHPNFRVFAAMNPATDVGKKDLPMGIRSCFTEIYVESPDRDVKSLQSIVETYIGGNSVDRGLAADVTNLYLEIQRLANSNMLVDGANQKPHFSLRTLTRTLTYARDIVPLCSLRRALFEGFNMSFLTFLDKASESLLTPIMRQYLFGRHANAGAELKKPLLHPNDAGKYVQEGHHWLRQGHFPTEAQPQYIITPFVRRNLDNLVRAASTRRFPVLIQGPTSAGKTSMIEYLAKKSGNKFVRINNHEHTDLREYLGTYVSSTDGKLQFREGILVEALRQGHWLVLDELNLAPTDVLEALNRLLDDNRELLIPETQEVVRPHEDFMLFATQNPAGLYGGRKVLSRAFRNRFLEIHFDDIPVDELNEILQRRMMIPESWSRRIVNVYKELSSLRQENRLFEQKSFATLRDLFRWALRKADSVEQLACNGYMLLAERVRKPEERKAVKEVIERVMSTRGPRVRIDEDAMYDAERSPDIQQYRDNAASDAVVWTRAMRRLYVLVAHALRHNEPVLLVGETGCGKTTVCQMLADTLGKSLHIVNAHQNTETGDLIGAQRPIRNRAAIGEQLRRDLLQALVLLSRDSGIESESTDALLQAYDSLQVSAADTLPGTLRTSIQSNRTKRAALFEWADGSLVHAMKNGDCFLLDEISLADDSVLERLNSVLEPDRTLLLAEKGPVESFVRAAEGFQFLATMNPGGDYGKRELSPALRNRFTEIWVPALSDVDDILQIVRAKLNPAAVDFANTMVAFAQWFNERYNTTAASSISIRDMLAWVQFINRSGHPDSLFTLIHGAAMVFIDTLGANPAAILAISQAKVDEERRHCITELSRLLGKDVSSIYFDRIEVVTSDTALSIGSFSIPRVGEPLADVSFTLTALTTRSNAMRVLRALQLPKPLLLEGNPGVGKTTLVTAIAKAVGKPLARINLSEQTDLMDLFGSDVPVQGAQAGAFAWRDAPFLRAMKSGDWVLLDEMNLASQSVLEGLNACLDHRGEVYISELDQTFQRHPDFRLFAAQNPHHQGGGRKGLPASFVNRFTVVYADVFRPDDLLLICQHSFPGVDANEIEKLIRFVARLDSDVLQYRKFGLQGGPWEFNLRDTLRWLQLLTASEGLLPSGSVRDFLDTVFTQRFRSSADRRHLHTLFTDVFGGPFAARSYYHNLSVDTFQVGVGLLDRDSTVVPVPMYRSDIIKSHLEAIESCIICIQKNWPVILAGGPGSGKTNLIEYLAAVAGAKLTTFSMNADIDAMDLVGGYEQVDPLRQVHSFLAKVRRFVQVLLIDGHMDESSTHSSSLLYELADILNMGETSDIADNLAKVNNLLRSIAQLGAPEELLHLLKEAIVVMNRPIDVERAQFEWVDGILVQALQEGDWLVLDNANLCSPSVLDRLNSLLEPNGYLVINEHTTDMGEARIVKPHPNFRIFLTMDPRYGELSRAMRNRAVELFLFAPSDVSAVNVDAQLVFSSESSMYRFRNFFNLKSDVCNENVVQEKLSDIAQDHLSVYDCNLVSRFHQQRASSFNTSSLQTLSSSSMAIERFHLERTSQYYQELEIAIKTNSDFGPAQSIYTLNNEYLVRYNPQSASYAHWLAAAYDVKLELLKMDQAYEAVQRRSNESKPLTRLEISMASARVRSATRDSTVHVGPFLLNVKETVKSWLSDMLRRGVINAHQQAVKSMKHVLRLWWDLFTFVNSKDFDEAVFQTYLVLAHERFVRLNSSSVVCASLATTLTRELDIFRSSAQLSTGLSMERLWNLFRPRTAPTFGRLQTLLKLEALADRFDAAVWQLEAPIPEVVRLRSSFGSAIAAMLERDEDVDELIVTLNEAINDCEARKMPYTQLVAPYFQSEFEGLCQSFDLSAHHQDQLDNTLEVLAQRPTKSIHYSQSRPQSPARTLVGLTKYLGSENDDQAIALRGNIHLSLWHKMQGSLPRRDGVNEVEVANHDLSRNIGNVDLAHLDLLQTELDILGCGIATRTPQLCSDQLNALDSVLHSILSGILEAHSELLGDGSVQRILSLASGDEPAIPWKDNSAQGRYFQDICEKFLRPVLGYLNGGTQDDLDRNAAASSAWICLAIAGMLLYVPDRIFDPALKAFVERQSFIKGKHDLEATLSALQLFEQTFTGATTNLRIRMVEQDLVGMGPEPSVPAIARPPTSYLAQLQGDFDNLLYMINLFDQNICEGNPRNFIDGTTRRNLDQLMKRLREGYRAYDDITGPVVGFLNCLKIGIILAERRNFANDNVSVGSHTLHYLPFFGTSLAPRVVETLPLSPTSLSSPKMQLHALRSLALTRSINASDIPPKSLRDDIHALFGMLYDHWKTRLSSEQAKTVASSSLYTYRGDQKEEEMNEEEDFQKLFPDFDQSSDVIKGDEETAPMQQLAVHVAGVHEEIYAPREEPTPSRRLLSVLQDVSAVVDVKGHAMGPIELQAALPRILLSLRQTQEVSSSHTTSRNYNIYTDPKVAEARKLVSFVHKVQRRFRSIQQAWPEHAILSEVLNICSETLAFKHVDPVAKFLTKAEKLHETIYQWQSVASREYSATDIYEELTNLLVSWRQLELGTWARLLDIEMENCVQSAKEWWFIAYENIIAVPESLAEARQGLKTHARDLLETLQIFFSSATLGQFHPRLRLLEQFREQLSLRVLDLPALQPIHAALDSFIRYYQRFTQPVQDALIKGRQALERDVKNVLQLASWKDRTINALKQSSKASHRKLFKLIRTFRALLNQPVETILKQGLPDVTPLPSVVNGLPNAVRTKVDTAAITLCAEYIPGWSDRPSRFSNVPSTVALMRRMSVPNVDTVNGTAFIDSFLANLESSMSRLQKVTPSTLTEENKHTVKQLKTMKRRLFADTLKELRQMGLRSNLSGDVLATQDSLATVLSSRSELPTSGLPEGAQNGEYYLHKLLDSMPHVREVSRAHSEDLTSTEISRSVGYLESLLHMSTNQRETLLAALRIADDLEKIVAKTTVLWNPEKYSVLPGMPLRELGHQSLVHSVLWLPTVLDVGAEIVSAQSQLGKFNSEPVVTGLRAWSARFSQLCQRTRSLPDLPKGLSTTLHACLSDQQQTTLQELRSALNTWIIDHPLLAPVLKQIVPWVEHSAADENGQMNGTHVVDNAPIQDKIYDTVDLIFGSLQDLERSLAHVPDSIEDQSWLVREDRSLAASMTALHPGQIASSLDSLLDGLHVLGLQDEHSLRITCALIATVMPIIQQYKVTVHESISRYANLYCAISKMSYRLAKSFIQIGQQGFCTPPEKSHEKDAQTDNAEGGTGLGEGEGAEDISKDVQDDEDLSELAQEPNTKTDKQEIEDEKDAVDMGDNEMEGKMGDAAGESDQDDAGSERDEGQDEMDEEVGDVDDLGPSTVDEKLWDGGGRAEKDKEDDKGKGAKQQDEQAAAQENEGRTGEDQDNQDEIEAGAEESEAVGREEMEKVDPHMQQGESLDLPEELDMDGNKSERSAGSSDDMMDDFNEDDGKETVDQADDQSQPDNDTDRMQDEQEGIVSETGEITEEDADVQDDIGDNMSEQDANADDEGEEEQQDTTDDQREAEPAPSNEPPEDQEGLLQSRDDEATAAEDAAPSDAWGLGADAEEQGEDQASASASQRDKGAQSSASKQQQASAGEGDQGQACQQDAVGWDDDAADTADTQAFKKLGDALERWYNNQRQIHEASEQDKKQEQAGKQDVDMADADFEHLLDDDSRADAQALGAAAEDQAHALDESMALDVNERDEAIEAMMNEEDADAAMDPEAQMDEAAPAPQDAERRDVDGRPNAFVGDRKDFPHESADTDLQTTDAASLSDVEEVDTQLSTIHLTPTVPAARSPSEAWALWTAHESSTRTLSLSLTEQLRLILAPTHATKLRGDFRTGKRLNVKRIIPYIASQYKRDKIWMRRSVPSKRSYQIMIALDDSRSMAENGSDALAFETVALVARALAMLEAGELCIVGFGEEVEVAHEFGAPFTSEAGVEVFRRFGFRQTRTDVRRLVARSIELFREARLKAGGSGAELWQLQLVISDGLCEDHATIQRLVRQAQEERIMIVFVIVDAANKGAAAAGRGGDGERAGGQSILDLQTAEFGPDERGEMKLVRRKYLDTFPFRWYLVVRDVRELPGVLATALRQWFAEVVDTAA